MESRHEKAPRSSTILGGPSAISARVLRRLKGDLESAVGLWIGLPRKL